MKSKRLLTGCAILFVLGGCTGIPEGLEPVTGFEPDRYLGTWYEIARLDHSFERGLSNVSATYSRQADGTVAVRNRGYEDKEGKWKEIEGKAKFLKSPDVGSLKVSFFGPFYSGYHIIVLDKDSYSYAVVAGYSRDYLWILSRQKTLEKTVLEDLVSKAQRWGFKTEQLIYVAHSRS
jgi:apolipoprotein D and lipocalin family protein